MQCFYVKVEVKPFASYHQRLDAKAKTTTTTNNNKQQQQQQQ
jgi:hypothetical protein